MQLLLEADLRLSPLHPSPFSLAVMLGALYFSFIFGLTSALAEKVEKTNKQTSFQVFSKSYQMGFLLFLLTHKQ